MSERAGLVERLKDSPYPIDYEAAAALEADGERIEELEEGLRGLFADAHDVQGCEEMRGRIGPGLRPCPTCRTLRALLEKGSTR